MSERIVKLYLGLSFDVIPVIYLPNGADSKMFQNFEGFETGPPDNIMSGHHLILGRLTDLITGETIDDTHDERYRQKLARLLIGEKGYLKSDIQSRHDLVIKAGEKCAVVKVDFIIRVDGRMGMVIKYGPGSLTTRHRSALAASRLVAPYQIPLVVVTNGKDCDVLNGDTGERFSTGLDTIPDRKALLKVMALSPVHTIDNQRVEMEARIMFAYEVDDSCPCDTTVCRF